MPRRNTEGSTQGEYQPQQNQTAQPAQTAQSTQASAAAWDE